MVLVNALTLTILFSFFYCFYSNLEKRLNECAGQAAGGDFDYRSVPHRFNENLASCIYCSMIASEMSFFILCI